MTVKITLIATHLITVDEKEHEGKSPDEIGDEYANAAIENPAVFVNSIFTEKQLNAEVELTKEP